MKKIIIHYWKEHNLIRGFYDNDEFDYSIEKQNEIIQTIIEHGLSSMIRPNMGNDKDILHIWIDKGRFCQY